MSCKYGMYTCSFTKQKNVCDNCNDADSYQWDENRNHGGKREGAGRKPKYGEPTITVAFRIPQSTKDEVTKAVKKIISKKKPQP